jgi:hypothetical protein
MICVFLSAAKYAPAQNVSQYVDLVIVLDEPSFLSLDEELVTSTLRRIPLSELLGEGMDAEMFKSFMPYFQYVGGAQPGAQTVGRSARMYIECEPPISQDQARSIWQRMLQELDARLFKTAERLAIHNREQQEFLKEQLRAQLVQAQKDLEVATQEQIEAQVENSTSAQAVREQRRQILDRRLDLQMQIAAAEARKEAIQEQISLLKDSAQKQASEDEIAKQLETIIQSRAKRVEQVKQEYDSGHAPQTEVLAAQADLAQARIDLLRHEKGTQDSAVAKQIASLNEQLTAVTIDLAESRKLLQLTSERSDAIGAELANQLLLEGKLQTIETDIAQRRVQVQQLRAQLHDVESAIAPRSTIQIVPWNE